MIGEGIFRLLTKENFSYDELITVEQKEDFDEYEIIATLKDIASIKSEEEFISNFLLNDKDTFELIITVGEFDPIVLHSKRLVFSEFNEKLDKDIEYKDSNVPIQVKFRIFKENKKESISIFDLSLFEKYLSGLGLNQILSTLSSNRVVRH